MTSPTLIPASAAHANVLAALHRACFDDPWDGEAFARLLTVPGTRARIAETPDGTPVGFVMMRGAAGEAEILTIGVVAAHRRTGIAAALLVAAQEDARAADIETVFLEVAVDNTAGRAFYARQGFGEIGRRPGYYNRPDGRVDAVVLSRAL